MPVRNPRYAAVVDSLLEPSADGTTVDLPPGARLYPDYVFSADYTLVFNGQTLSFAAGIPHSFHPVLNADLLAALNAAGAPMERT